jgi:predicted ATP-dependent serine protease
MKGTVLYVALEEKRSEVKNHFKLLGAKGDEDLYSYIGSVPAEANSWLEKAVKSHKPILIIIDTLFRFAQVSDVNDYARVTAALSPLLALARENNTHLMVIHHARKGGGDGGDSTLGSTAIFGSVDTSIILKKNETKRTIETQQRYGTDMESTLLVFDEVSKSVVLGGTKEEDDLKRISGEMLEFLRTENEPADESTINNQVEGRTKMKRAALRDLLAKGEVKRIGTGKRGDPFLYSCSLVPNIYQEQEKQETKSVENPDSTVSVSCSQDLDYLKSQERENALEKAFDSIPAPEKSENSL